MPPDPKQTGNRRDRCGHACFLLDGLVIASSKQLFPESCLKTCGFAFMVLSQPGIHMWMFWKSALAFSAKTPMWAPWVEWAMRQLRDLMPSM